MGFYELYRKGSRWPGGWLYRLVLPILFPSLVVGIGVCLWVSAKNSGFDFDLTPLGFLPLEHGPSSEKIVQAIKIRLAWTTAALVLGTAVVVAIAVAIETILRTFGGVLLIVVGSISSAIGGVFYIFRQDKELVLIPIASKLFDMVEYLGEFWFESDFNAWKDTVVPTEALFVPLIVLVWLAFLGLLWPARRGKQNSADPLILPELIKRRRRAEILLICSAVVLVSFLVQFYIILRWPVLAFANPEPVIAIASGVTALTGVFFTLILTAISLPVMLNLSGQAMEYASSVAGCTKPSEIRSWLSENWFGFSGWRSAPEVFAVIAPSIVGVVGPLLLEALTSVLTT